MTNHEKLNELIEKIRNKQNMNKEIGTFLMPEGYKDAPNTVKRLCVAPGRNKCHSDRCK